MAPEDEVGRLTREVARLQRALDLRTREAERARIDADEQRRRAARLQAQFDFEHGRTAAIRERGQRLLAMFKEVQ